MTWTLSVAKPAQKQVAGFPAKAQDKIAAALLAMADDPFSGDIIKLEGESDRWRRRVGSYRIFFTVDPKEDRRCQRFEYQDRGRGIHLKLEAVPLQTRLTNPMRCRIHEMED